MKKYFSYKFMERRQKLIRGNIYHQLLLKGEKDENQDMIKNNFQKGLSRATKYLRGRGK